MTYGLKLSLEASDGSGTQKPENPTQPEGFLLTRTRPEPEKNMTNPTQTQKIANPT